LSPPVLTGTASKGSTLTASTGTWASSTPLSFAYRWERCRTSSCKGIRSAVGSNYRLAKADVGYSIRVIVSARNAAGAAERASEPSGVVVARTLSFAAVQRNHVRAVLAKLPR
jgi:hypothetical protein